MLKYIVLWMTLFGYLLLIIFAVAYTSNIVTGYPINYDEIVVSALIQSLVAIAMFVVISEVRNAIQGRRDRR